MGRQKAETTCRLVASPLGLNLQATRTAPSLRRSRAGPDSREVEGMVSRMVRVVVELVEQVLVRRSEMWWVVSVSVSESVAGVEEDVTDC